MYDAYDNSIGTILKFLLIDRKSELELESDLNSVSQYDWKRLDRLLREHAILPLCLDCISLLPEEYSGLKNEWKEAVYANIYSYSRLVKWQNQILNHFRQTKIPVAVLKGTSVAKYYSKPQLRTMGDVDLLVKPSDYGCAACCLTEFGCHEITSSS